MSNRSRGRLRPVQQGESQPLPEDEQKQLDDVMEAYEQANTRGGLRKLVGLMLDQRDESLKPDEPDPVEEGATHYTAPGDLVREPTLYEKAILAGLASRQVGVVGRSIGHRIGEPPGAARIEMYAGTVDPVTVADRRRRNKAARAARHGRHVTAGGSSKSARRRNRKERAR